MIPNSTDFLSEMSPEKMRQISIVDFHSFMTDDRAVKKSLAKQHE